MIKGPDHLGIYNKNLIIKYLNSLSRNYFFNSLLFPFRKILRFIRKQKTNKFYKVHEKEISEILEISSDEKSKETIKTQLDFIKNYDYSGEINYLKKNYLLQKHESLLDKNEYFPEGVINLDTEEVFIDGGAFTGDTLKEIIKKTNGNFEHVFCFEPDKSNFDKLILEKNSSKETEKITCYPYGLYSENKKINFTERGIGSSISVNGENSIDVVALDSLLPIEIKNKISFIKLDIEGAEVEALKGMKDIIAKNKPKMAVCVYHTPEHFWEVPLYLKSLNPDYKIYFRQHALSRLETVCYAV